MPFPIFILIVVIIIMGYIVSISSNLFLYIFESFKNLISRRYYYKWYMKTTVHCKDGVNYLLRYSPAITFNSFLSVYSLNPSSWELMEYCVRKDKDDMISYIFPYKEWKKYDKWRKKLENSK